MLSGVQGFLFRKKWLIFASIGMIFLLFQWNRRSLENSLAEYSNSLIVDEESINVNERSKEKDNQASFEGEKEKDINKNKNDQKSSIRGSFDEDGEVIEGTNSFENVNESSVTNKKRLNDISDYVNQIEKMKCPSTTKKVVFLYPHVNKAGGRSIEGTFDEPDIRHRFVSSLPRSKRPEVKFELRNGHKSFRDLLEMHCNLDSDGKGYNKVLKAKECEDAISNKETCARWIFTMREPMSRSLSAFYTSTGREVQSDPDLRTHFTCPVGSQGAKILSNPNATFEDFASLPIEKQQACYPWIANRHVHYLAGEVAGNGTVKLEIAKRRLARMGWVGLAEQFDKSMKLLSWTFALDLVLYTPVFNINDYPKELSLKAQESLKKMNVLDIELYNYAKKLFDKRIYLLDKHLQSSQDNGNEYFPFICDKEVICWDKTKGKAIQGTSAAETRMQLTTISDDYWSIKSPPPIPDDVPAGEWKERVVCAPKKGCFRG